MILALWLATQTSHIRVDPSVSTTRAYKVGEQDRYNFSIVNSEDGSVKAVITLQVAKLYPGGDADLVETVSDFQAVGKMAMPKPAPRIIRLSQFGVLTGAAPDDPVSWSFFSTIIPNADHLSGHQYVTFERALPSMGQAEIRATARIVEVNGDQFAFAITGRLLNPFGGGPTTSADLGGSLVWDGKLSRYIKGSFGVTAVDPKDKTAKPLTLNFSFDRIPAEPPPKKTS